MSVISGEKPSTNEHYVRNRWSSFFRGSIKGVESNHRMNGSDAADEILYRYCFQSNCLFCSLPIYVHQAPIIRPKRSCGIGGFRRSLSARLEIVKR